MAFTIPNDLLERRRERVAAYCQSYKAILAAISAAGNFSNGPSPDYLKAVEGFRQAAHELGVVEEAIRRYPIVEYWRRERESAQKRALALESRRRETA